MNIYFDSINGDDSNTGLDSSTPKKTLEAYLSSTEFSEDIIINLSSGIYNIDTNIYLTKIKGITLKFVGNGLTTQLNINYESWGDCFNTTIIEFNKLKCALIGHSSGNGCMIVCKMYFNNVVFNDGGKNGVSYFCTYNDLIFKNCIMMKNIQIRKFIGTVIIQNCYGYLKLTDDTNISTNSYHTETPNVDEKYKILDDISSSIGVYSGIYNWGTFFLIMQDNKYYNILSNNYNGTTFEPLDIAEVNTTVISENGFSLSDLFIEITVNEETFKPISKFNKFNLISTKDINYRLKCLKDNSEMLIFKTSQLTKVIETFKNFNTTQTINNGSIKFAFLVNEKWYTYTDQFLELNEINMPLKDFNALQKTELEDCNNAKLKIKDNGIDITNLSNIDFNNLLNISDEFVIAIVLNVEGVNSQCILNNLKFSYEEVGMYYLLENSDVKIGHNKDFIKIIPNRNMNRLKLNIGTGGTLNIINNYGK